MKKILITGGAGFIGSYLANRLVNENYDIDIVDNQLRGDYSRLDSKVKIYNIDLTVASELNKLPKNYDWIFHLAAVNGTDNFYKIQSKVFEVGVKSCLNIYDYFKYTDTSIIVASSAEVYQTPAVVPTDEKVSLLVPDVKNPRYSYGGSKIFSELLVMNYGLDFFKKSIIFRPHNIYGPNMGYKHVVPQLIKKVVYSQENQNNFIELIGSGNETRAFCYIDDLVDGLIILMEKGEDKEIYHIGNDDELSIFDLAKKITNLIDTKINVKKGEQTHFGGTMRRCPDITKMKKIGYQPKISIDIGLEKSVDWYLKNENKSDNKLL
jgi:UDP-glucose 4-epimerase